MKKVALLSLAATTVIMASGWRIPEQSVNAVALSGAYVANASGADAAYYNPANMAFMDQGSYIEGSLTYIHLSSIDYRGDVESLTPATGTPSLVDATASSKKENFVFPALHYVGEAYGDYRFGISLTLPGGLSKRWEEGGASSLIAKEFTLEVYELNPVVSYKVTNDFSVAAGVRFVYSRGVVSSAGTTVIDLSAAGGGAGEVVSLTREMKGDDIAVGLNVAASYKPVENWTLSATYRSKVDLEEKGVATLSAQVAADTGGLPAGTPLGSYSSDAFVTVPLPAVFALATAYTFNNATTVELEFDRTFWGDYNTLDFAYPGGTTGSPVLDGAFDAPQARNWNHANAYRIGVTHTFNKAWTGMLGYTFDETAAPTDTISFELPDSDAHIFSLGARYNYNDRMSVGIAGFYLDKNEVSTTGSNRLKGAFSDAAAYFLTMGLAYKF